MSCGPGVVSELISNRNDTEMNWSHGSGYSLKLMRWILNKHDYYCLLYIFASGWWGWRHTCSSSLPLHCESLSVPWLNRWCSLMLQLLNKLIIVLWVGAADTVLVLSSQPADPQMINVKPWLVLKVQCIIFVCICRRCRRLRPKQLWVNVKTLTYYHY